MSREVNDIEKAAAHAHATLEQHQPVRRVKPRGLLDKETAKVAFKQAFVMLRPDLQWTNPVMFVVLVGAVLTLLYIFAALLGHSGSVVPVSYFISLDVWLFLTVLFANFATALAEARGKAQAESLKKARHDTTAFRLVDGRPHRGGLLDGPKARGPCGCGSRTDDSRGRRNHRGDRFG